MKNSQSKMNQFILFTTLALALVSCGGGGDDGGGDPNIIESNPDFLAKSSAVTFSQINLYEGHISLADRNITTLDVDNLSSGELITIEIEFEISDSPCVSTWSHTVTA